MKRATLADVATRAGVHYSTVSRALTRPDLVTEETRVRVEAAAAELEYLPNPAARNLVRGSTGAIGLLVPDIANPFFAAIVQAATAEASEIDQAVLLVDTRHRPELEVSALDRLRPQVDGIIVCTPVATEYRRDRGPLVHVNRRSPGVSSVAVDQSEVVRLAFEHLDELGHRHVAWMNGPTSYWSSRQRRDALVPYESKRGRTIVVLDGIEPTFEGGHAATDLAITSGATALVAFNDLMALGVMAAAQARGLRVPDDLSVVGSDDVRVASMSWPPLSSVASPIDELGETAVRALQRTRVRHHLLQPTLSVRGSTGPPR